MDDCIPHGDPPSDLEKLPGIRTRRKELLNQIGVYTIEELSRQRTADLEAKLTAVNSKARSIFSGDFLGLISRAMAYLKDKPESELGTPQGLTPLWAVLGIRKTRAIFLRSIGTSTAEDLASANPRELWGRILQRPDGKIFFGTYRDLEMLISRAKALISGEIILREDAGCPFELYSTDGIFDCEYDTRTPPVTFIAICLGIPNLDGSLTVERWFAKSPDKGIKIAREFAATAHNWGIERLLGWQTSCADEHQLSCINCIPEGIPIVDLSKALFDRFILPIQSQGLKELSVYLGIRSYEETRFHSGLDALVAWEQYLITHDLQIAKDIQDYNEADVRATWEVAKWLQEQSREILST